MNKLLLTYKIRKKEKITGKKNFESLLYFLKEYDLFKKLPKEKIKKILKEDSIEKIKKDFIVEIIGLLETSERKENYGFFNLNHILEKMATTYFYINFYNENINSEKRLNEVLKIKKTFLENLFNKPHFSLEEILNDIFHNKFEVFENIVENLDIDIPHTRKKRLKIFSDIENYEDLVFKEDKKIFILKNNELLLYEIGKKGIYNVYRIDKLSMENEELNNLSPETKYKILTNTEKNKLDNYDLECLENEKICAIQMNIIFKQITIPEERYSRMGFLQRFEEERYFRKGYYHQYFEILKKNEAKKNYVIEDSYIEESFKVSYFLLEEEEYKGIDVFKRITFFDKEYNVVAIINFDENFFPQFDFGFEKSELQYI